MRTEVWHRLMLMGMGMAIVVATGCRAPRPSFNFWAPFGSSRVAPPQTGSYNNSENYYPNGTAPAASGATESTTPAPAPTPTTQQAPVTPVQPNNDFPIDSSSGSTGQGAAKAVSDIRVGKWRPPNHEPQVRSVSFDRVASPAPPVVTPPEVPTVTIPTSGGSVGAEPGQLQPDQTSIAIPIETASKPAPDPAVAKVGYEESTVTPPSVTTGGWNRRGEIAPK